MSTTQHRTRDRQSDRELGALHLEQAVQLLAAASSKLGSAAFYLEHAGNRDAPVLLSAEVAELSRMVERVTQVTA